MHSTYHVLYKHVISYHKTGHFECGLCERQFDKENTAICHLRNCQNRNRSFRIEEEEAEEYDKEKVSSDDEEEEYNSGQIVKINSVNCFINDECNVACADMADLDDHLFSCHGLDKFRCYYANCLQSFDDR